MKIVNCYSVEDIRIEDIDVPDISDDEILIKTIYCGLCGSDIVKIIDPDIKKPVKLGHEVIGTVKRAGKNVKKFNQNEIITVSHHIPCFNCIYCDHLNFSMCRHFRSTNLDPQGFSEYIRLSAEHIKYNAFLIEDKKYIKNILFTEPLGCCMRAVEGLNIKKADSIIVIGCGTIGILFIALLKYLYKARIAAVDIDNTKLSIAERFGADIIINSGSQNIVNIKEKISGFSYHGFDAAILTYTAQDTVDMAMAAVRDGGRIQVFAGPLKEKNISVDFEYLYKNEIMLFSSYSASPDSCRKSFELLKDGKIDYTPLISDILPVEDFKKGLNKALSQKYFKIVFYFDDRFK